MQTDMEGPPAAGPGLGPPLRLLFVGQLPPHPGGSAISVGQLLARLAALDCSIHAVAPITIAALRDGDPLATCHPALRITRYEVPAFDVTPYEAPPDDLRQRESAQLEGLVPRLIAETDPQLVVVGRETFAWYLPAPGRTDTRPYVLFVRGNPTSAILRGTYPREAAAYVLAQYRKFDLIIAVADHLAEGLRRLGVPNVLTIPNAVDTGRFAPRARPPDLGRALGIGAGDLVVMLVANLHRRKRPMDFVESASLALRHEPRLKCVVVGDGVLRPALEARCRELGITERFRFTGWVSYDRMPEHMNLADVVVLPSEAEGLARVYLEAQASGRVLIASDIAAAREAVVDGETGLLFPLGDLNALATTILRAAADPGLRDAIGGRARVYAARYRSVDAAAIRYRQTLAALARRGA
jgi:glycosyltransferase involved in cell wall biosynthesis